MRECYSFVFIIKKKEYYCIWYSDEKDGFLTESNQIIFFYNNKQLNEYATSKSINFEEEINELSIVLTNGIEIVKNIYK